MLRLATVVIFAIATVIGVSARAGAPTESPVSTQRARPLESGRHDHQGHEQRRPAAGRSRPILLGPAGRRRPGRPGPGRRVPAERDRPRPALLAHVTGMLAGYGAAVMLILMSRSPAIEHGVGAGPPRPVALPDGSGDHRPGRRACGRGGPGLGRRTRGRRPRGHPGGARLARPVRRRPGAEAAARGRPGLGALGPASDAVRALARAPSAHLPRRRRSASPTSWPGPNLAGNRRRADRLEPALRVRLRHGRPLPGGAAAAPAVAAPAQGGGDRPRVRRRGQHRDVRWTPGRAAGRGRASSSAGGS